MDNGQVKESLEKLGRERESCSPIPLKPVGKRRRKRGYKDAFRYQPAPPTRGSSSSTHPVQLIWDHRHSTSKTPKPSNTDYYSSSCRTAIQCITGKRQYVDPSPPRSDTRRRRSGTVHHTSPTGWSDSGYGNSPQTLSDNTEGGPPLSLQPVGKDKQSTVAPRSDDVAILRRPSDRPQNPINPYQALLDAVELAKLLAFLGGAEVPGVLLWRAGSYYTSFNSVGEIHDEGVFNHFPVLAHEDRVISTIQHLEYVGITNLGPGPLHSRRFIVPPELRSDIEGSLEATAVRQLKIQASKLVCHTFPSSQEALPYNYMEVARVQLPQAQYILGYFDTLDLIEDFSIPERTRFIEFCLSLSRFCMTDCKHKAIAVAEKMNGIRSGGDTLLSARLSLRRRELSRLFPSKLSNDSRTPHPAENEVLPTNAASNTFLGEKLLLEARQLIDHDRLSSAWSTLDGWKSVDPDKPSTLEKNNVIIPMTLLKAIICHFSGHFTKARDILIKLFEHHVSKIAPSIFTHLVAVSCELGELSFAGKLLDIEYQDPRYRSGTFPARQRRLRLATAEIHLMEGLWAFKSKDLDKASSPLHLAKTEFQELQEFFQTLPSVTLRTNLQHFSVLAGLAMIAHLECEFPGVIKDQLEAALSSWDSAWLKAVECQSNFHWEPCFTQTMILYAKSHITLRQNSPVAEEHFMKVMKSYLCTQTYWTGFGTLFFDIVGDLWDRDRGTRMVRLPNRQEPDRNGFPFMPDSIRPIFS